MSIFYSKTQKGFYISDIHGENIPADAVEILEEQYHILLKGQSEGQVISSDPQGYPTLVERENSPITILSPIEKLALAGLSVEDLKSILGL